MSYPISNSLVPVSISLVQKAIDGIMKKNAVKEAAIVESGIELGLTLTIGMWWWKKPLFNSREEVKQCILTKKFPSSFPAEKTLRAFSPDQTFYYDTVNENWRASTIFIDQLKAGCQLAQMINGEKIIYLSLSDAKRVNDNQ